MWQILVLTADSRRPIGASSAATISRWASACCLDPDTKTTKSSAYAEAWIMPTMMADVLVRAVCSLLISA